MSKFDLKSWAKGFVLGLAGKTFPSVSQNAVMFAGWLMGKKITGMRKAEKAPVAYLYNGVPLPALPDRHPATYLYAVICRFSTGTYMLYFLDKEKTCNASGTMLMMNTSYGESYTFANDTWESGGGGGLGLEIIWANYDIYYPDSESAGELAGTLRMAASEPVPVYE